MFSYLHCKMLNIGIPLKMLIRICKNLMLGTVEWSIADYDSRSIIVCVGPGRNRDILDYFYISSRVLVLMR